MRLQLLTLVRLFLLLLPALTHAQAIDRGREADVLRLLQPFVDEGPVGTARLSGIAIRADGIDLELTDPQNRHASLHLQPQQKQQKSFVIQVLPAPTPELGAAQNLLKEAIAQNDDGQFFSQSTLPDQPPPPQLQPQEVQRLFALSAVLWLLLILLILRHAWLDQRPIFWLSWLAFALIAALVRRNLPFSPLHANGHGLEELALTLGGPENQAATGRYVAQYGPSWLLPLRAMTQTFGQTHQQLALASSALGGLATALGTVAAWRLSRNWLWTLLAGALLLWTPVAARVGHSESGFVVAQLLVATGLWLGASRERIQLLGVGPVLMLLTLGHPVGIVLAAGTLLLVLAMQLELQKIPLKFLLPSLLFLAAGTWLQLHDSHASVADRLTEHAEFHLPVPTDLQGYALWLHPTYAPRWAMLAGAIGLWSFGRGQQGIPRWLPLILATSGAVLVLAAGLMVNACVSDGLRYQATFAPVLALLVARVSLAVAGVPFGGLFALILGLLTAFGLHATDGTQVDAQGQAYRALVNATAQMHGDIWLVTPERGQGHERVVVEMPGGQIAPGGPVLKPLPVGEMKKLCRTVELPPQTLVWLDHACHAQVPEGQPNPCADLRPLVGNKLLEPLVNPLPRLRTPGMAGEFQNYPPGRLQLTLATAKCP